ncbi:MAG TPA: BatA and WFA domain-containing protein [Longimicrobiales bacterium]|nr:BatA and WFA domain-containing protein [Longimicrobiales bacterium]
MSLLAPLFMLGLLAIVVPILVHLVHRERKEPLPFPSLMFLRRVPIRSTRRQRIRHWLLFLMRVIALILLAFAFARPWMKSPKRVAATAGKDVVVLVDRSYSMSARGVWAKAQRAALDAIASAGVNDRVTVIGFGERAELLARAEDTRKQAVMSVERLRPGSEVTRYAPALRLASSVLTHASTPAEIFWITDRQRSGWRNAEQMEVPPGTVTRVVDVRAPTLNNVRVAEARMVEDRPSARIINGTMTARDVTAELRINGRLQQARNVSVAANGAAAVTFDPIPNGVGSCEIKLTTNDDLAADNVAYFAATGDGALVVRVVTPDQQAAFFFQRALAAGDSALRVSYDSRLSEADREFVRNGGGVIVLASRSRVVERATAPASVQVTDVRHPLFAAFSAEGGDPFAGAHVLRYSRLSDDSVNVLARMDDGAPALTERRLGAGRILSLAMPLDRSAGDLVLQPGFVPLVQQMVQYASSGSRSQREFMVGSFVDLGEGITQLTHPGVFRSKSNFVVANVDPAEADYTAADVSAFEQAIIPRSVPGAAAGATASDPVADATADPAKQSIWWYLLASAFALLAAETLLGKRISSRMARTA